MAITFTANPDYLSLASVIGVNNSGLVNLSILGATNAGPAEFLGAPYSTTLTSDAGGDTKLNIGETFTLARTPNPGTIGGTPQTLNLTMVGSGTLTSLGTGPIPREIIIGRIAATDTTPARDVIIFPNSDGPSGLLGSVGSLVEVTVSTQAVGFDFETLAPLCFASGTMLATPDGLRAIEDLVAGDLMKTKDNGPQPIRWIGSRMIGANELAQHENLRPIRIRAGALGENTPSSDLIVSPQHRILVRSKIAIKMFDSAEVLVAAKQLLQLDGVDIAYDMENVEYFHLLFDQHEVVFSNGAETESLYTGPQAIKSVGAAALEEIYAIFPELKEADYEAVGARPLLSGREGRKLAMRHIQNRRELVS